MNLRFHVLFTNRFEASLLHLTYALTCAWTMSFIQFAVSRNMKDAIVVMLFSFGVLVVTLFSYSGLGVFNKLSGPIREQHGGYSFWKAARTLAIFGFASAFPTYGLLWLWLADYSFVNPHGAPVWEQTIYVSFAVFVAFAGRLAAAFQSSKRQQ